MLYRKRIAQKCLQIICIQPVKRNLHIFSFSKLHIRLFKSLLNFLHFLNNMSKSFSKMYILSCFVFLLHFYYIT